MNIARGLAFVYTDSKPVFDLPDSYGWVGLRSIGPIPVTVIVMIIVLAAAYILSLIHISEPTRQAEISYAVFCLKKKKYCKDVFYSGYMMIKKV